MGSRTCSSFPNIVVSVYHVGVSLATSLGLDSSALRAELPGVDGGGDPK